MKWALVPHSPLRIPPVSALPVPFAIASTSGFDAEEELRDSDGIEIVEATDGRLGLTDIGDVPADDWAADTGPTKNPDTESKP